MKIKRSKVDVEFVKRLVFSMLTMSVLLIIMELYVPIKRIFFGDKMTFSEVLSYIRYLHYFPYILVFGITIGFFAESPENKDPKKM